jgi:hypothetical protein
MPNGRSQEKAVLSAFQKREVEADPLQSHAEGLSEWGSKAALKQWATEATQRSWPGKQQ